MTINTVMRDDIVEIFMKDGDLVEVRPLSKAPTRFIFQVTEPLMLNATVQSVEIKQGNDLLSALVAERASAQMALEYQNSEIARKPARAWYDRDNQAIYTSAKDAEFARAGGNDVVDLVERA